MDIELPAEQPESKKRVLDEPPNDEESRPKKAKLYTVKQFRKQLSTPEKLSALKEYSSLLAASNSKHDHVLDYLKNGGNCLELLQTLESDSAIPPALVFDMVTQLLLGISAKHGQYYSSASESCKYLINNYLPVVHKMLGLSSSKEERKVCLKLLTAIAALSSKLAKDILLNVKLHSASLELLTKHTGEKNSVRDCFLHFLTAFLVESDLHTLSILLEKSGLLTSVISGLQYDDASSVCILIAAMKSHILENPSVMKTEKMHVFNTGVVKDIVNLYNWKGPEGLKALDKNNKTVFEVNKLSKSKVSECVHDFLLVLCTSHKSGVIFKDPLVGLGKKNLNSLMYTVLDSLDRPWEHSYASELVIKICRSCPDLTKTMWGIVKPYLEPRLTEKWLNTMSFAGKLIEEMEPACIEYCAKDLTPQQLAQVIEVLVSPAPILKTLLVDNKREDASENVTSHIMKLLAHMLAKIDSFLTAIKKWTSASNLLKTQQLLCNYVARLYPSAQNLLENWKKENIESLESILDILNLYKTLAPQLLHNLASSSLDFKDFLLKLSAASEENPETVETLQIKIISIFVDVDHSYFLPKTDIFGYILPILLKHYHKDRVRNTQKVLFKLLRNTGIFDNNLQEINIWINGIFNFNTFTESFANDFVEILRNTTENMLEYQKELSEASDESDLTLEHDELIEYLLNLSESSSDNAYGKLKHRYFSPALLGVLKHCFAKDPSKNLKKYLECVLLNVFHNQTNPQRFGAVIQKYQNVVPSNVFNYVVSWVEGQATVVAKIKGALEVFKDAGEAFLNHSLRPDLLLRNPDVLVDILRLSTFYFSNLVVNSAVAQQHATNLSFLVQYIVQNHSEILDEGCLELILGNPSLLKHFNVGQLGKGTSSDVATKAALEVVKHMQKAPVILDNYLYHFSNKLFQSIGKILKHPKKQQDIREFLEVFPLNYANCVKVINDASHLLSSNIDNDNTTIQELVAYSLERILICNSTKPIDKEFVRKITAFLASVNKQNKDSAILSKALKKYLEFFPHNISDIDQNLFSSILTQAEYNKDCVDLALFLLQRDLSLTKDIEANISPVCDKKGLILPVVHILVKCEGYEDLLEAIYEKLEASIVKAIQKPQKVGQHFAKDYNIACLIEKFMPLAKCLSFCDKVQKFEVAEVFHAKLLEACYIRVLTESDVNEKHLSNIITTFMHLEIALFKKSGENDKVTALSEIFNRILDKIALKASENLAANESFKTFSKFALKFGVSGQHVLLTNLKKLVKLLNLNKDDASLLLEMLLSHSEFLNVVLGEHSLTKLAVLSLFLTICEKWSELMEKSHVAVLLSAYRGMVTRCDRTVLALLKLFESKPEQTKFYDFQPFLWGRTAATHYSVRAQIASNLARQPKVSDVLGILKEDLVNATITNYPLKDTLFEDNEELSEDLHCYDLKFLLPLFCHILAPEQQVKTYVFTRSGALCLTVLGLASQTKEVRQAGWHVLARLHFHLEARQTGKDNLLWIRFVEALCKGVADFKLNSFSAIFFARMSLILTNPKHVMYTPLSSYLMAKQDLDLSTVPELYTLLFSPDVNFKEHRNFILEILRDGMKTDKDFVDFLKSMGYKLISELYSSCLSDGEGRGLILDVLGAICKIPLGVNILIENYSLLSQLAALAYNVSEKLFNIFLAIAKNRSDKHTNKLIYDICLNIYESNAFAQLKSKDIECFYEILYTVCSNNPAIIPNKGEFIDKLTVKINDRFCNYVKEFGCSFINEQSVDFQFENNTLRFLRLLLYKLLK